MDEISIRESLLAWYRQSRRDLPWRRTRDPYRIWLSEIMLQQTRVAAVIPYYERFLERYPTVEALAAAGTAEVLALWSGLGYYRRARAALEAARQIAERGAFPASREEIAALPGVGGYTAAAVASIAFDLPHAVVDGNVLRVISRLMNDPGDIGAGRTRKRFETIASSLLDPQRPGEFNQALMELGATVCLPREPKCLLCPLEASCAARHAGTERSLPVKLRATKTVSIERVLLIVERPGAMLFWKRNGESSLMPGFWELPEPEHLPGASHGAEIGRFRHAITHHDYRFTVRRAALETVPEGFEWLAPAQTAQPLSTIVRKALRLLSGAAARSAAAR
jgi:A/G-specific adenine glycosylase